MHLIAWYLFYSSSRNSKLKIIKSQNNILVLTTCYIPSHLELSTKLVVKAKATPLSNFGGKRKRARTLTHICKRWLCVSNYTLKIAANYPPTTTLIVWVFPSWVVLALSALLSFNHYYNIFFQVYLQRWWGR